MPCCQLATNGGGRRKGRKENKRDIRGTEESGHPDFHLTLSFVSYLLKILVIIISFLLSGK